MSCIRFRPTGYALSLLLLLSACTTTPRPHLPPAVTAPFAASPWGKLPGWQDADLAPSFAALLQSCRALRNKANWQPICAQAETLSPTDNAALHQFFETDFSPYQVSNPDGSSQGLITGYYEPKLMGSRVRTERFR